ncbi:ComEC/Rec2 family competence protein [Oscillospiraceae bacterium MB08-C2-2]|nr:ComEC/Rec2 family competence protein [Oscillospiraceae bacterium MB08-C2-2]
MAKGRNKRQLRRSWIVILLVSVVVGFCVLSTMQNRDNLEIGLPELESKAAARVSSFFSYFIDTSQAPQTEKESPLAVFSSKGNLSVHFIDVGQGKAILIQAPDKTVLIDGGDNATAKELVRYLKDAGAGSIDLCIPTHAHADHIGGLDVVMDDLKVKSVVMTDLPHELVPTSASYTDFLLAIAKNSVTVEEFKAGKSYDLGGGATLTLLAPLGEYSDLNDMSIVSRLDYRDTSFLFTGDASGPSELDLIESRADLSADVLDVGHHGSRSSTTQAFLDQVNPSIAVLSCGLDNSYKHPHKEVLERLGGQGAQIYRTDLQGTIVMRSDGSQLSVSAAA